MKLTITANGRTVQTTFRPEFPRVKLFASQTRRIKDRLFDRSDSYANLTGLEAVSEDGRRWTLIWTETGTSHYTKVVPA